MALHLCFVSPFNQFGINVKKRRTDNSAVPHTIVSASNLQVSGALLYDDSQNHPRIYLSSLTYGYNSRLQGSDLWASVSNRDQGVLDLKVPQVVKFRPLAHGWEVLGSASVAGVLSPGFQRATLIDIGAVERETVARNCGGLGQDGGCEDGGGQERETYENIHHVSQKCGR